MKYTQKTFQIPVSFGKLSEAEYEFRVGKITREEYEVKLKYASGITETTESLRNRGA